MEYFINYIKSKRNFIVSGAIVAYIIITAYFIISLKTQVSILTDRYDEHVNITHSEGVIDFSNPLFQTINSSFSVGGLDVSPHLDGIKIKGKILNTKSIAYEDSEFEIFIDNQTKSFFLKYISPGSASEFNIYIPTVSLSNSRWGTIKYNGGNIRYR